MPSCPSRNLNGFLLLLGLLAALVVATMALPGPSSENAPEPVEIVTTHTATPDPILVPPHPAANSARVSIPVVDFLQVQVRDAQGNPVPNAQVRYYQETIIGFPDEMLGRTDSVGTFLSGPLPNGSYRVRTESPGFLRSSVKEACLPAPEAHCLAFELQRLAGPSQ